MTETEMKLRDADIQFRLALGHTHDEEVVRSCINSFITTARSVTMVMERESNESEALLRWYKSKTQGFKSSPDADIWKYFDENRVYTTHKGVITPKRVVAQITGFTRGGVAQQVSPEAKMTFDRFANPPGADRSGGIFRLCEKYLKLLGALVAEWRALRASLK